MPLEASGLVRSNEGRSYDFFRGRLMIPIRDIDGRTVGFGARQLDDGSGNESGPKYVNTPETVLFRKGRLIYGLDRALGPVRRGRHLILVEGYTDVMAAHQVGLSNVAAVLGTSTTDEHAALIRICCSSALPRYTTRVRPPAFVSTHGVWPVSVPPKR